jgi:hypothetical protein
MEAAIEAAVQIQHPGAARLAMAMAGTGRGGGIEDCRNRGGTLGAVLRKGHHRDVGVALHGLNVHWRKFGNAAIGHHW